jgi:hypothetical protein
VTLPNHDWNKSDRDRDGYVYKLTDFGAGTPIQDRVLLSGLNPLIKEPNDSWKKDFMRDDTYPPLVLESQGDGTYTILQGNHRIIVWKEWGFTHGPAWVFPQNLTILGRPVSGPFTKP